MSNSRIKEVISLGNVIFLLSIFMFAWLAWYFYTGIGGAMELSANLVPIALMLQILHMHKNGFIYKRLPAMANHVIVIIYLAVCVYAFYYFHTHSSKSPFTGRAPTPGRTSSWACWFSPGHGAVAKRPCRAVFG